jgi:hypothetical protein
MKRQSRFTELMEVQIDTIREAVLQLSYQVERIANALEKPKTDQKQEGVTGPALDLAEQLVESWNKSPVEKVKVIKYQVFQEATEYRDSHNRFYYVPLHNDKNIYQIPNSTFWHEGNQIKNVELEIVDSLFIGTEKVKSKYHPDYKGDPGT